MMRNYISCALRNLLKNKLFSLINIVGLTVGLAIFLFANILADYERSYDTFFDRSERIFISLVDFVPGGPVNVDSAPSIPSAAAAHMRSMAGVERAVRGFDRPFVAKVGERKFYQSIRYFDDGFLDIFDLDFIAGDAESALTDPRSLIISDTAAEKYFGDADPMGRVITLDDRHDMRVTGVFRSLPGNSHFTNSFIMPDPFEMGGTVEALSQLSGFDPLGDWETIASGDLTYVLLAPGVTPASLQPALDEMRITHVPEDMRKLFARFRLAHISRHNTFIEDLIGIPIYAVIQVIGALILAVAILNYTNLATAQAIGRAVEVGIRKTMGANRKNLFAQFTVEAVVLSFVAATLSLAVLQTVLPALNEALNRNATFDIVSDPGTTLFLAVVILVTGVVSGAYPAAVLAWMQVVKVLHGGLRFGRGMHRLRNVMLGLQFSFAVILTTMVFVIKAQNDRVDEAAQVFDRDHIVNLLQIREDMRPSYDRLVSELRSIPGVLHVTGENLVPFGGGQTLREMSTSRDPEDRIVTSLYRVDEDFMSVFDVPIVAGRGFSRRRGDVVAWTDDEAAPATVNILLNELAVTEFGWDRPEDAVGRTVFEVSTDAGPSAYQIVGVVEDRDFVGIYGRLKPAMFMLQPEAFGIVSIRVAKEDVSGTVAAIDAAWNRVYPAYPITRNFLDEQFRSSFELFELISHVLSGLALMAVALAGLGLFGLAAFLAERRTKEIGLRKAMGASITGIVRLLLWQFSRPVAVALVIGTPLAVLASQQYLDFFASRVSLSPTVFAVSSALIMGFAWLTVAAHAVRVARENPVKALRYK